jgi:hypothetical protein
LVLAVALIGDLLVGGWIVSMLQYGSGTERDPEKLRWLVGVRTALTSRVTDDRALLESPPEALVAAGFLVDEPERVASWARDFLPRVPYLDGLSADSLATAPVDRARQLALLFSKNGGPGCGHFRDIEDTLLGIAEDDGYGCCVDHARALLALGESYGLRVRTVRHSGHTFNEVWDPERRSWIMIDSQYAVMARGANGRHLSTLEIRDHMLAGDPVDWEFFGNSAHRLVGRDPASHRYFGDPAAFRDFKVVWGNNFLEQHERLGRLRWLPKAPREFVARIEGVMPADVILADANATATTDVVGRRTRYLAVSGALLAGTLVPPPLLLGLRWRERRIRRELPR